MRIGKGHRSATSAFCFWSAYLSSLRLSKEVETKLTHRAAATGKPLAEYISTLVESVVETHRTLAEISGPVYQRFLDNGTTDEEPEELEKAKHEMRAERHRKGTGPSSGYAA